MPNSLCECPVAGWCHRHKIEKSCHQHLMCRGEAPTPDRGWKYFVAWEKGLLGATQPEKPHINPPQFTSGGNNTVMVKETYRQPANTRSTGTRRSCSKCGTEKTWEEISEKSVLSSGGPGTELLKIYNKAGFPKCPACISLASQMNKWGVDGCRKKVNEIVDDILPRARAWIAENHPFIHRLTPGVIEDAGIKWKIKDDVEKAISCAVSTESSGVR